MIWSLKQDTKSKTKFLSLQNKSNVTNSHLTKGNTLQRLNFSSFQHIHHFFVYTFRNDIALIGMHFFQKLESCEDY